MPLADMPVQLLRTGVLEGGNIGSQGCDLPFPQDLVICLKVTG